MSRYLEGRPGRDPERRPSGVLLQRINPFSSPDLQARVNANKRRGVELAKSLQGELFDKVNPASRKQSIKGIDFFGIIKSSDPYGEEIRMPFYVVSSAKMAAEIQSRGTQSIIIVSHNGLTDEYIRENILQNAIRRLI